MLEKNKERKKILNSQIYFSIKTRIQSKKRMVIYTYIFTRIRSSSYTHTTRSLFSSLSTLSMKFLKFTGVNVSVVTEAMSHAPIHPPTHTHTHTHTHMCIHTLDNVPDMPSLLRNKYNI